MDEHDHLDRQAALTRIRRIDELPPLTVGETFQPFATLTELPDLEGKAQECDSRVLTRIWLRQFKLGKIPGSLALVAYADVARYSQAVDTPLGPVQEVKSLYGDGETDTKRYTQLPLGLGLTFGIASIDEFEFLERHKFRFDIGGKQYYLNCAGNEDRIGVGYDLQEGVKEKGIVALYLHPEPDHGSRILLPWDVEKLRTIQATIVEKPTPPLHT